MVMTILVLVCAVLLLVLIGLLIYRASRTFDANPNHTYVVQSQGEIVGALREPATLWDPKMSVLRDKDAPDITYPSRKSQTGEFFTKSLVNRRTGRISLTVNTCTPKPFRSLTLDRHQLEITANVVFRLDIERIHISSQLDNFGATFANRIENLFDNEITRCNDEDIRAQQTRIEQAVTQSLREIEEESKDGNMLNGMPLGIKIYEANFSFVEVDTMAEAQAAQSGPDGRPIGPIWIDQQHIDKLADTLANRDPEVRKAVMRMIELQTRQNVVEMLCKSGGLVAFTAKELGLNDVLSDAKEERGGANRMTAPNKTNGTTAPTPDLGTDAETISTEESSASREVVERDYYGRPIPKQ
ncbi:hypothetical protein [Hirschia baltica]|uniref:Band 7 domain-containing protein n=1 Tax=Hirschia baltica (strain ATCC 49814 / DSM 5838 / IFAM 1418) TaxID=582402 RepID=C6XJD4_HIRBI|nr:hypothetical protein [Hirschia baltica]ACT59229.1 hypothetical protein Hbal_1541 [Hirschia baltica ATCC 49814]